MFKKKNFLTEKIFFFKIDVRAAANYLFIKRVYVAIYLFDKYVLQKVDKTSVDWRHLREKKAVSHNEEILLKIVASI